jgi:hypothetical protein
MNDRLRPKSSDPLVQLQRLARQLLLLAAAAVFGSVLLLVTGQGTAALGPASFAALLAWGGQRLRRYPGLASQISLSLDRITRGRFAEAEALLDAIPKAGLVGQLLTRKAARARVP